MVDILTNVFSKLSEIHKTELSADATKLFKEFNGAELREYRKEKDSDFSGASRFFFVNFPITHFALDVAKWDSFNEFVEKAFNFSLQDSPENRNLELWMASANGVSPIYLFFTIKDISEIRSYTPALREMLVKEVVGVEKSTDKTTILSFDREGLTWRLNRL